jgi:hypothetical protein
MARKRHLAEHINQKIREPGIALSRGDDDMNPVTVTLPSCSPIRCASCCAAVTSWHSMTATGAGAELCWAWFIA